MMPGRAPGFWQRNGVLATLLAPLQPVTAHLTARRIARPGWRAPVPVVCCGNATVGGAGKTTLVLDLGRRLRARGIAVHFLTRGHGGAERGPLRVGLSHDARAVGDEALLLAALAPTWVSRDRAAGARAATLAGAKLILMDDGLQNPGLRKDLSLLVIDGATGFGNNRLLPAGPLREPAAIAAGRCGAAVLIGEDRHGALGHLPPSLPVLHALLAQDVPAALAGFPLLAFAGIGHPEKFRATLGAAGLLVADFVAFPDHHFYARPEIENVLRRAERLGARPVTTPKDAARLPPDLRARVEVAGIRLAWRNEADIEALLDALF